MFRLLTTEDFAAWFSGLRDAAAEDVAATLDVIERLGANNEAPGSSEWLLWYEHPIMAERVRRASTDGLDRLARGLRYVEQWGAFLGYTRRAEAPRVAAGEWLDRSFYGDSVRRAESLWRRFLEGAFRGRGPETQT